MKVVGCTILISLQPWPTHAPGPCPAQCLLAGVQVGEALAHTDPADHRGRQDHSPQASITERELCQVIKVIFVHQQFKIKHHYNHFFHVLGL